MNDFDPTNKRNEVNPKRLQLTILDKRPLGITPDKRAHVIGSAELGGKLHSFVTSGTYLDSRSGEPMVFGTAVDSEDGNNTYDASVSQEALDKWRQAQEQKRAITNMLPDWPQAPTVQPESTANWPEPREPSKRVPRSTLNIVKPQ